MEWRLWEMNPMGYHVTNVLLHATSAVLLWRVLANLKIPGAWLAALLFLVHPANVESVAWIAERKNTLSMFFYLLTLLLFVRFEQTGKRRLYIFSLVAFLLSLLAKTSVVMLPFVLLGLAWWQRRNIAKSDLLRSLPFFGLSLAMGLVTIWFQSHRAIATDVIREAGMWTRLGDAGLAIWFYLYKAVFPWNLSFVYPEWEIPGRTIIAVFAWLGLAALFAIFWWKRATWGRHFLFSFGYFVLMLLPILGFLNIYFHRYSLVADHWQYFALPGIIVLFVSLATHVLQSRLKVPQTAISVAGLGLVIGFGFAASRQAMIYNNSETLWRDTLSKNPNSWLALNNFGLLLEDQGKPSEATSCFEKSLRLKPDQTEGRNNLGTAWLNQGKYDEAMAQYQQALIINPRLALTHYNIANVLDRQNKTNEAMAKYQETLRLEPEYVDAHNNLGCMFVIQGKMEEGMAHFREALRVKPGNVDTLNNLGSTLIETGKPREAIPLLQRAIQIKPDYSDAYYNLGNAFLILNQSAEAINAYSAALKINPQMPMVYYKLGLAFLQSGNLDQALTHFLHALELNPNSPEGHYQIAAILSAGKNSEPAIAHYKEAIRLKPDWVEPLNNLAWILATNPNEKLRDGKLAVELAERACDLTENKNSGALDTLAAASAEHGEFSKAIRTAEKAADIEANSGNKNEVVEIRARLEMYRTGKAFRE